MHRAMDDHRSAVFPELTAAILPRLKPVFGTTAGETFVFAGGGSAMWDCALTNTLDPGARVLAVRLGQFSHLFTEAARRLGFSPETVDQDWGTAVDTARLAAGLAADADHGIQAVLVVHNETATGVTSDIAAVRAALDRARHPALLFVDGVSSVASLPFEMDRWGVDAAIAGSQKGFMLPPGLGLLALSQRALARVDAARSPRAYYDLRPHREQNPGGYFPYTPPVGLLWGLREVLDVLHEEGLPQVFARHQRLARGVRSAVAAWGLPVVCQDPAARSDTVTAIRVPEGCDARRIISGAFDRYRLALGGGLGPLAGKAFRIGHMGCHDEVLMLGAVAGTELALLDAGVPISPGVGVAAAVEAYRARD
jgi:alanine-glyoxylate transaminase/serine-glyoxylate transaminase/serine-pyruvate transaminase